MPANYHVSARSGGKWAVIKEGATRAASIHGTKSKAVEAAENLAQRSEGLVFVSSSRTKPNKGQSSSKPSPSVHAVKENKSEEVATRIGRRVARARAMRGMSLRDLSTSLDKLASHTTLQKIEKGLTSPDSRLLSALARTLEVRPDYFFQNDTLRLQNVEYRKLTKLGRKLQTQLEEQAFEFYERYYEVEQILSIKPKHLPHFDLSAISSSDLGDAVEKAADDVRKRWKLGLNPIPEVHLMLENHGLKVKLLPETAGFDGFSSQIQFGAAKWGTIALSRALKSDLPRLRFTALHELAHLILSLPATLEHKKKESLCHRFAGAFLIPASAFTKVFGQNRTRIAIAELQWIKSEWGISFAATMARAKNLNLITPSRYKSFCIMSRKWCWHKEEPGKWHGNESSNRFEPLVLRALAEGLISSSKAASLLNISLPELGEKFETVG